MLQQTGVVILARFAADKDRTAHLHIICAARVNARLVRRFRYNGGGIVKLLD